MAEEIAALVAKNSIILGCRWIFKTKYRVDFIHTFSPVVNLITIWILFSIAAQKGWFVIQLYINNCFVIQLYINRLLYHFLYKLYWTLSMVNNEKYSVSAKFPLSLFSGLVSLQSAKRHHA